MADRCRLGRETVTNNLRRESQATNHMSKRGRKRMNDGEETTHTRALHVVDPSHD